MNFLRRFIYGILLAILFGLAALLVGIVEGKLISTLSLIGTSIVLEAQPAAAASLALRFHPLPGAIISILGNLIPIPLLMLMFDEILQHWPWFKRKLDSASKWTRKYEKLGIWILLPLSPILGAYVCIGLGYIMLWNRRLVLCSVMAGMILSTFIITYGGDSVVHVVRSWI